MKEIPSITSLALMLLCCILLVLAIASPGWGCGNLWTECPKDGIMITSKVLIAIGFSCFLIVLIIDLFVFMVRDCESGEDIEEDCECCKRRCTTNKNEVEQHSGDCCKRECSYHSKCCNFCKLSKECMDKCVCIFDWIRLVIILIGIVCLVICIILFTYSFKKDWSYFCAMLALTCASPVFTLTIVSIVSPKDPIIMKQKSSFVELILMSLSVILFIIAIALPSWVCGNLWTDCSKVENMVALRVLIVIGLVFFVLVFVIDLSVCIVYIVNKRKGGEFEIEDKQPCDCCKFKCIKYRSEDIPQPCDCCKRECTKYKSEDNCCKECMSKHKDHIRLVIISIGIICLLICIILFTCSYKEDWSYFCAILAMAVVSPVLTLTIISVCPPKDTTKSTDMELPERK